jgi:hypothetical protein
MNWLEIPSFWAQAVRRMCETSVTLLGGQAKVIVGVRLVCQA